MASFGVDRRGAPAGLAGEQSTDDSADDSGAKRDNAGQTAMMMMHFDRRRRWRWRRRRIPMVVVVMMHRYGRVVSAMRRRKRGSREREACQEGCKGFHGLVHITPSLSFWLLCASRAYIRQGRFDRIS